MLCFDGFNTINYKNGDAHYPILKDTILSHFGKIKIDSIGNIYTYLYNANKIVSYNPYLRKLNFVYPKGISKQHIYYSQIAKNGQLYYISENKKTKISTLYTFKNNKEIPLFEFKTEDNKSDNLNDIEFDEENFYATSSKFIYVISKKGKLRYKFDNLGKKQQMFSTMDNRKVYFMTKSSNEISIWNNKKNKIQTVFTFPNNRTYYFERFAVKNEFIVCVNEYEIFIINTKTKTIQNLKNEWIALKETVFKKPTINSIMDVDIVIDGSIIIATKKFLYKLTKKGFSNYQFKEEIKGEDKELSFREITKDTNENLFVSYYLGLATKNKNSAYFNKINIPKSNFKLVASYSLSYWNNKLLWNNFSLDLNNKRINLLTNKTSGNHATQYIKNDSIWIYNWYSNKLSVNDLKNNKIKNYTIEKSVYPNHSLKIINDIIEDKQSNNLWIATLNNGMSLITKKGKLVKHFSNKQVKTNFEIGVLCLHQNKNKLWFGISNGLSSLDISTNKITNYNFQYVSKQGQLLQRKVYFILPKDDNQFYLGTDFGLLLFDIKTLEYFELPTENPLSYQEYNRKSKFHDTANNKFYVGTISGLYSFKEEDLKWNKPIKDSKIRITKISVLNNKNKFKHYTDNVNTLTKINLKANDVNLEINYSAVKKNTDVFYSYRIKEMSNRWSKFTKEQQLNLTGLKAGLYNIELKTLNGNNSSFESIEVVKAQYWYLIWYVQLLFFLLIIGLVVWIIRYLFKQKLKKQEELISLRNKISRDLHDEVGTILTAVSMQSEILISNTNSQDANKLSKISVMSRQAMNSMRDTVWSIDSEKDNVVSLINRMKDFLLDAFEDNDKITFEFNYFPKKDQSQTLQPDIRQNIYLIFKEAVINTLKHSNGDKLLIDLIIKKQSIHLKMKDNGKVLEKQKTSGLGLHNIKKRAKLINAILHISVKNGFKIEVNAEMK